MGDQEARTEEVTTLEFEDFGAPATIDAIKEAEARLGVRFPDSFRELLTEHNGTHPEPSEFDLDDDNVDEELRTVAVAFFFGVGVDRESLDIERVAADYEGRIPNNATPIGRDPGGSLFLLSSDSDGSILFWAADEEPPEGDHPSNVYRAAVSFEAMLAKLTSQ